MRGDTLASGGRSASFPASNGKISQERWDEAVGKRGVCRGVSAPEDTYKVFENTDGTFRLETKEEQTERLGQLLTKLSRIKKK